MNETVVAGRVKRAVIGLDLLVTKNEVHCRFSWLCFLFSCSTLLHNLILGPDLIHYSRSCDIRMPACTHKMGCFEIIRLALQSNGRFAGETSRSPRFPE